MTGVRETWVRHRLAVLLIPVATVAVHQLRYLLAFGSGAGHQLALSGDDYVGALLPGLVLLVLAAVGFGLASLRRAARGQPPAPARRAPSLLVLWAAAATVLLAGYLVQESLEVMLGSAPATVLGQAFGHGGWWVLPAAG